MNLQTDYFNNNNNSFISIVFIKCTLCNHFSLHAKEGFSAFLQSLDDSASLFCFKSFGKLQVQVRGGVQVEKCSELSVVQCHCLV